MIRRAPAWLRRIRPRWIRRKPGLAAAVGLVAAVLMLAVAIAASSARSGSPAALLSPSPSASPTASPTVEPGHTPWYTPDPAIWRFEGTVRDEQGRPLAGVCVHGPSGCRAASIHTDVRGKYFFDVAQMTTIPYDLWFVLEGYETHMQRVIPQGPTVFDVTLRLKVP